MSMLIVDMFLYVVYMAHGVLIANNSLELSVLRIKCKHIMHVLFEKCSGQK